MWEVFISTCRMTAQEKAVFLCHWVDGVPMANAWRKLGLSPQVAIQLYGKVKRRLQLHGSGRSKSAPASRDAMSPAPRRIEMEKHGLKKQSLMNMNLRDFGRQPILHCLSLGYLPESVNTFVFYKDLAKRSKNEMTRTRNSLAVCCGAGEIMDRSNTVDRHAAERLRQVILAIVAGLTITTLGCDSLTLNQ